MEVAVPRGKGNVCGELHMVVTPRGKEMFGVRVLSGKWNYVGLLYVYWEGKHKLAC